MEKTDKIVTWLFETGALKVCPENKPFWYTSGKIGPYYINTHFLYGNESKALELLSVIDSQKDRKLECSLEILRLTLENYQSDEIYKGLIDSMVEYIENVIGPESFEFISGGERRDWFFSLIIAHLLKKPHITLFKDLSAVVFDTCLQKSLIPRTSTSDKPLSFDKIKGPAASGKSGEQSSNSSSDSYYIKPGTSVLHIADIITEASSYTRAWIPAVKNLGALMSSSLVVIDRLQGGAGNLASEGVESHALVEVKVDMFDTALALGYITVKQHTMLAEYAAQPDETMKAFLEENPEFLKNALSAPDARTRERARLCLDSDFYGL